MGNDLEIAAVAWDEGACSGERRELEIRGASCGFCWIPPGAFKRSKSRTVSLARGFWYLETPVTQGLWTAIMKNNPSAFCLSGWQSKTVEGTDTTDFPVETVSWDDCQECIKELNALDLVPEHKFRLPTEAEWEYACRAGTTTEYWWGWQYGDTLNGDRANCNGNYPYGTKEKGSAVGRTTRVKSYEPNPWGLYDVHGNVWEWIADWYAPYPRGAAADPTGSATGSQRVIRGGSWNDMATRCRSSWREPFMPKFKTFELGFRLVLQ